MSWIRTTTAKIALITKAVHIANLRPRRKPSEQSSSNSSGIKDKTTAPTLLIPTASCRATQPASPPHSSAISSGSGRFCSESDPMVDRGPRAKLLVSSVRSGPTAKTPTMVAIRKRLSRGEEKTPAFVFCLVPVPSSLPPRTPRTAPASSCSDWATPT